MSKQNEADDSPAIYCPLCDKRMAVADYAEHEAGHEPAGVSE